MKIRLALFITTLCLLAAVAAHAASPQFSISATAPTTNTDGTPITAAITYQLYEGVPGKEVKFGTPVTAFPYLATVTPTPKSGDTVCFQLTAIVNLVESDKTPEACVTVPYPTPGSPANVTIKVTIQTAATAAKPK